jgi:hypothetical protein
MSTKKEGAYVASMKAVCVVVNFFNSFPLACVASYKRIRQGAISPSLVLSSERGSSIISVSSRKPPIKNR